MDDQKIIELFFSRSEKAISETDQRYRNYCYRIAWQILRDDRDSEEILNDTWLQAWHSIPPHRPDNLAAYLGKITRNLAINRRKREHAMKRGGDEIPVVLDELRECIPSDRSVEQRLIDSEIIQAVNRFLWNQSKEKRQIFLRRYWYADSIQEISKEFGISESKVKVTLFRIRRNLCMALRKEGLYI